jgi:hypothetical protein
VVQSASRVDRACEGVHGVKEKRICWLSAGVSSFITGYLERDKIDEFIYIDIDDQHPDSMRFIKDCEKTLDKKITVLKSPYGCVENAIRAFGSIENINSHFYPCTGWLKKRVRKEYELDNAGYALIYVWGMDCTEHKRAERLREQNPGQEHQFPLLDRCLTKEDAHSMCEKLGIKRPLMYDLGYSNNNCIGCVKGGMGYWNKIRTDFPDVFEKRAKLERDIGNSIFKNFYLDELPRDAGRMSDEIMPECSLFCMMAENIL